MRLDIRVQSDCKNTGKRFRRLISANLKTPVYPCLQACVSWWYRRMKSHCRFLITSYSLWSDWNFQVINSTRPRNVCWCKNTWPLSKKRREEMTIILKAWPKLIRVISYQAFTTISALIFQEWNTLSWGYCGSLKETDLYPFCNPPMHLIFVLCPN